MNLAAIIVEVNMICKGRKAQTSQKQNQRWKIAQLTLGSDANEGN